ncbi:hypothetical protein HYU09_00795 [Candidatus Woesearchaeota archaeon]|nr:hypothetical protein [Candidatus Woesearchaeota archaeon]
MRLKELADLMEKSVEEVKIMLEKNDIIELKLTESNKNKISKKEGISISELRLP